MQNLLAQKALYIKGFGVFEMAFRARKVSGTFEKEEDYSTYARTKLFHFLPGKDFSVCCNGNAKIKAPFQEGLKCSSGVAIACVIIRESWSYLATRWVKIR